MHGPGGAGASHATPPIPWARRDATPYIKQNDMIDSRGSPEVPFDLTIVPKVLKESAAGIAKLGDSIAHVIALGVAGYDDVVQRRSRVKLLNLYASLVRLNAVANPYTIRVIEHYIQKIGDGEIPTPDISGNDVPYQLLHYYPDDLDSQLVRSVIRSTMKELAEIFEGIEENRSDFILEDTYQNIMSILPQRIYTMDSMNGAIAALAPPTVGNSISSLRDTVEAYKQLMQTLDVLIRKMADYLKPGPAENPGPVAPKLELLLMIQTLLKFTKNRIIRSIIAII